MDSLTSIDVAGTYRVEAGLDPRPTPFTSTLLVVGTSDLNPLFQVLNAKLPSNQPLPLLLIGSVLFDLLMRTQAMEMQPQELAQHMEVELEERLQWPHGALWHSSEGLALLEELYGAMRRLVWPQLQLHPHRAATAVFQRLTGTMMELGMMRMSGEP